METVPIFLGARRLFNGLPGFFGHGLDGRLLWVDLEGSLEERQRLAGPAQVKMALSG